VLKNDATGLGSSLSNDAGSGEGDLEVVDEAPSETSQGFYSCYPQISNITSVCPRMYSHYHSHCFDSQKFFLLELKAGQVIGLRLEIESPSWGLRRSGLRLIELVLCSLVLYLEHAPSG